MTGRETTAIILVIVAGLLIVWDIYLAAAPPTGDTISEVIRDFAYRHPIIPFAIGVLIGHWFWGK
jgi:hypothetical protein